MSSLWPPNTQPSSNKECLIILWGGNCMLHGSSDPWPHDLCSLRIKHASRIRGSVAPCLTYPGARKRLLRPIRAAIQLCWVARACSTQGTISSPPVSYAGSTRTGAFLGKLAYSRTTSASRPCCPSGDAMSCLPQHETCSVYLSWHPPPHHLSWYL